MFDGCVGPYLIVFNTGVAKHFGLNQVELHRILPTRMLHNADIVVDLGANKMIKDRHGRSDPKMVVEAWGELL